MQMRDGHETWGACNRVDLFVQHTMGRHNPVRHHQLLNVQAKEAPAIFNHYRVRSHDMHARCNGLYLKTTQSCCGAECRGAVTRSERAGYVK